MHCSPRQNNKQVGVKNLLVGFLIPRNKRQLFKENIMTSGVVNYEGIGSDQEL